MSDLRDRFSALDALDVPDVMSRARLIGPKPPEPDPTSPLRRAGALVFVAIVAILAVFLITRALGEAPRPADPPTPTPSDTAFRRDGEVISYSAADPRASGDLVAVDPDTGDERVLVSAQGLGPRSLIGDAAWSADGRWLAFEILGCEEASAREGLSPGVWVMDAPNEARQLMPRPCAEDPDLFLFDEFWAWSPTGAQLAIARRSPDGDALLLVDPATRERTDLGMAAGDVTSLAWPPDGSRIVYGAVPMGTAVDSSGLDEGSLYSVEIGGGDHALIAGSIGSVTGGETGAGILWSPDGTRIAVTTETNAGSRLYLMNADGSDLAVLAEGVLVAHVLGSPNAGWSPDGTRIAYTISAGEDHVQVWSVSVDGSAPLLVFESPPDPPDLFAGGPVWSPDGAGIAFRYGTAGPEQHLIVNADGSGEPRELDRLRYLSWRGGWYFCECYG